MKKFFVSLAVTLITLFIFIPATVSAQGTEPVTIISGDQIIVGNSFRLEANETLEGNLLVIGGTAITVQGSTINGAVLLIGGTITIDGNLNGEIVSIGGVINLEEHAVVDGSLTLVGANLKRSPSAQISGTISEESPGFLDNFEFFNKNGVAFPFTQKQSVFTRVFNATIESLVIAALAVVIGLLIPSNLKNMAGTLVKQPAITGGVGLLTILVTPIILVLLAITILLMPISLLAAFVFAIAVFVGYIVVGYEIGRRFGELFKDSWHPSIAAGVGTLLLSLITNMAGLIPCIGWILGFLVSIIGLGAVIISRFGSTKYAASVVQAMVSPIVEVPAQDPPNIHS